MSTAAEWPALFAGQSVKVFETAVFMGRDQRVLVTYLRFANPEAQAMLYASGLSRAEFDSILSDVQPRAVK